MTILSLTKVDVGMMEDVGTSANQLVQLDSNAKIPAVDGSLLTGLGGLSGSSDPTISTNPGTVGTKFINTTDGEIFICTDATAGANVWTNVGPGSGNIYPWAFQGSSFGYTSGGDPGNGTNHIYKYSFTTDGNATDIADLASSQRMRPAGCSSTTHGYVLGGDYWAPSTTTHLNSIEKFQFSNNGGGVDIADLTTVRRMMAPSSSETYGYVAGGYNASARVNIIEKTPFASDSNSTDVGDTTTVVDTASGISSTDYGYLAGGYRPPSDAIVNNIEKWSHVSDGNSADVGDLTQVVATAIGLNTGSYGYVAGGTAVAYPNAGNEFIQKFSFASGTQNSVAYNGILTFTRGGNNSAYPHNRKNPCGASSTVSGYTQGGNDAQANNSTLLMDKFNFATEANATNVGDLPTKKYMAGSHQY